MQEEIRKLEARLGEAGQPAGEGAEGEALEFVETAQTARPALGGDDVVAAGVAPGPRVAEALRALRDARLDRRVTDRDSEVLFVQGFVSRKEG